MKTLGQIGPRAVGERVNMKPGTDLSLHYDVGLEHDTWRYYFVQGGILGVAGRFPPAYMAAVFSGQAVGGIFASGTNVVVLALGASPSDVRYRP